MGGRALAIFAGLAGLAAACTTILGNDFEVVSETAAGGDAGQGAVGGGTGNELCLNGEDDDGDDLIDCADTDCGGGFSCVVNAPPMWSGPVILFHAPPPELPCPPTFDAVAYAGVSDLAYEPATCNDCQCTNPQVTCTIDGLASWDVSGCQGQAWFQNQTLSCSALSPGQQFSFRASPPTANLSSGCVESGGDVIQAPPPIWDQVGQICESTTAHGAGCSPDEVCVPQVPGAGFEQNHCIYRAGDHACPAPFDSRHFLYDDPSAFDDQRACEQCTCPFTGTCSGTTTVYGSVSSCATVVATVPNTDTCVNATAVGNRVIASTAIVTAECDPVGGAAIGEVLPNGPGTTVCCVP